MSDIVQKLRLVDSNQVLLAPPPHDTSYLQAGLICHEAAAEIERLRAAVLAEREACARLCDSVKEPEADWLAERIRARGKPCF